jgi:hypothetical protein
LPYLLRIAKPSRKTLGAFDMLAILIVLIFIAGIGALNYFEFGRLD